MGAVLLIDDPLLDGGSLAERSEHWAAMLARLAGAGGGLVVVVSHLHADDDLLAGKGAYDAGPSPLGISELLVRAEVQADEFSARLDRLRDDVRAACACPDVRTEREPPHRPWLDQRRCRPRKRRRWGRG